MPSAVHSAPHTSAPTPSGRPIDLVLGLAIFACSLWILSLRMPVTLEWGDEGYFVNAALRILDNEVIYRDFQHNYPPGRMYVMALLVKLFGQDMAVVRALWVFSHALAATVGMYLARRFMPLPLALFAWIAILFNSVPQNKTIELAVPALILLVLFRVSERKMSDAVAGLCLGGLAYFRHDVAVMGVMAYFALGLLQAHVSEETASYRDRVALWSGSALRFLLSFGLVGSVYLVYLVYQGAFGAALHDLVLSGFGANMALSKPFPPLVREWSMAGIERGIMARRLVFYFPPAVYLGCAGYGIWALRRSSDSLRAIQILVCTVLGCLIFLQVLPRTDFDHLGKAYLPAHILSFVLIALLFAGCRASAKSRRFGRAAALLLLGFLAVAMPTRQFIVHGVNASSLFTVLRIENFGAHPYRWVNFPNGRYKMNREWELEFYKETIEEIAQYESLREQETLISFPAGAAFNFLFGYRNPLAYDVLRPGEIGGGDRKNLKRFRNLIADARPRVLVHVKEDTNQELSMLVVRWASKNGYTRNQGGRVDFWIRSD